MTMSTYEYDTGDHQTSMTKPRDSGYLLTHDNNPPWMNDEPPQTRQPPTNDEHH